MTRAAETNKLILPRVRHHPKRSFSPLLRYLLTEYYLGELFLKRVSQDRLADLDNSKVKEKGY